MDNRDICFRRSILVVDDEPAVRRLLCRLAHEALPEAIVESASDGFEAKRKLLQAPPRLAILDLNLPGLGGIDLCRMIQRHPWLARTHVLAVTGQCSPEVREAAFNSGAREFLPKPFGHTEVAESIRRLLP